MLAISGRGVKGVIYFRFRHQAAPEKVEFDASEISVNELKNQISEKTLCNRIDIKLFALANDGVTVLREYLSESELVPSNTNLLVLRAPAAGPKGGQGPGATIVVGAAGYFAETQVEETPVEEELIISLIPETAVCVICGYLMTGLPDLIDGEEAIDRSPLLLPCCGGTACRNCNVKFSAPGQCIFGGEGCAVKSGFINKSVVRQVNALVERREHYDWRGVRVEEWVTKPAKEKIQESEKTEETIDLDSWEPKKEEIVDLDSLPSKSARKKKVVNLVKDEIKQQLKSEYTEEDFKKLFRGKKGEQTIPRLDIPTTLTIDFPKVLSMQEFKRWKNSF